MKNIVLIIFLFVFVAAHAQSLEDYLKMAEANNPGLKAKYAEFEAALQVIPQVQSLQDPTFSVSAFGLMIETRVGPQRAIFILNQMFPWFGTLKAQGDVAALQAETKFYKWLNARNEIHYQVKEKYYQLFELNRTIGLKEENIEILDTYKSLTTTQYINDKAKLVDAVRLDIQIQDLETEINVLQQKVKPFEAQFNQLINRDLQAGVPITDSLSLIDFETEYLEDSILANHPELAGINLMQQAWEGKKLVAQKQGMPKLGVGLNYTIIGERTDMDVPDNGKDAIMPMVSVSIPIFRKKYNSAIKEAEWMQNSLIESEKEISNRLLLDFEMAKYEKDRALEEYKLFEAQIKRTQQAIRLLLSEYSNSGSDFEEILRMQEQLLKYEIAKVISLKNYNTAIAQIEFLSDKKL